MVLGHDNSIVVSNGQQPPIVSLPAFNDQWFEYCSILH